MQIINATQILLYFLQARASQAPKVTKPCYEKKKQNTTRITYIMFLFNPQQQHNQKWMQI